MTNVILVIAAIGIISVACGMINNAMHSNTCTPADDMERLLDQIRDYSLSSPYCVEIHECCNKAMELYERRGQNGLH